MSENIEIREIDGFDVVRFAPQGVCSKLFNLKIKDNTIIELETIGGCSGNLSGISNLVKGMKVNDVINKLQGLPCGSRPTSCPDQIAQCLQMYVNEKSELLAK